MSVLQHQGQRCWGIYISTPTSPRVKAAMGVVIPSTPEGMYVGLCRKPPGRGRPWQLEGPALCCGHSPDSTCCWGHGGGKGGSGPSTWPPRQAQPCLLLGRECEDEVSTEQDLGTEQRGPSEDNRPPPPGHGKEESHSLELHEGLQQNGYSQISLGSSPASASFQLYDLVINLSWTHFPYLSNAHAVPTSSED